MRIPLLQATCRVKRNSAHFPVLISFSRTVTRPGDGAIIGFGADSCRARRHLHLLDERLKMLHTTKQLGITTFSDCFLLPTRLASWEGTLVASLPAMDAWQYSITFDLPVSTSCAAELELGARGRRVSDSMVIALANLHIRAVLCRLSVKSSTFSCTTTLMTYVRSRLIYPDEASFWRSVVVSGNLWREPCILFADSLRIACFNVAGDTK